MSAQLARLEAQIAAIDQAIIAESARWGDAQTSTPLLRSDWVDTTGSSDDPGKQLRDLVEPRHTVVVELMIATDGS